METKFLTVGERIVNLAQVTHASYDAAATNPGAKTCWAELTVSFTNREDCTVFYGEEATKLWELLQLHSFDLQTAQTVALKPID